MMKYLTLIFTILASSFSFASIGDIELDSFDKSMQSNLVLSPSDFVHYYAKKDTDLVLNSLRKNADFINTEESTLAIEAIIIEIVKSKFINFDFDAFKQSEYKSMRIFKNDSLIDLERLKFFTPEYSTEQVGDYHVADQYTPIYETELPTTSKHRMMMGDSAVGPDGKDVMVCRLLNNSYASYFEFSQVDVINLLEFMKSDLDIEQACISGKKYMGDYWFQRLNDFHNGFNKYN